MATFSTNEHNQLGWQEIKPARRIVVLRPGRIVYVEWFAFFVLNAELLWRAWGGA